MEEVKSVPKVAKSYMGVEIEKIQAQKDNKK